MYLSKISRVSRTNVHFLVFHLTLADAVISFITMPMETVWRVVIEVVIVMMMVMMMMSIMTACHDEHLPFLDIPGGDKPSSKLRVTIYSDWEAWSIPFPGHDD